jgi:uncharacterized protein (DUF433 family)
VTAQQKISLNQVIWIDPERMSGAPCFRDTRVPVQNFVDYIENGSSINEFLEDFPSVSREQLVQFMELAKEQLIECVSS